MRLSHSLINTLLLRVTFFSVRVILIWNRLPAALVQENNLSVFKSMLRTIDFSYTLLRKS